MATWKRDASFVCLFLFCFFVWALYFTIFGRGRVQASPDDWSKMTYSIAFFSRHILHPILGERILNRRKVLEYWSDFRKDWWLSFGVQMKVLHHGRNLVSKERRCQDPKTRKCQRKQKLQNQQSKCLFHTRSPLAPDKAVLAWNRLHPFLSGLFWRDKRYSKKNLRVCRRGRKTRTRIWIGKRNQW